MSQRYIVHYRIARDPAPMSVRGGDTWESARRAADWQLGLILPNGEPAPPDWTLGYRNGNWRSYVAIEDTLHGRMEVLRDASRSLIDQIDGHD